MEGKELPKDTGDVRTNAAEGLGNAQAKATEAGSEVQGKAGEVRGQKGYLGWVAETLHIRCWSW